MRLIAVVLLCFCIDVAARAQGTPRTASALNLKDIHGRPVKLTDYKGKVVLLNFWATWCPPCRTEIPDLVKLQAKYRNRGLRIVGVTYPPEKITDVLRFKQKTRMNYRIALGTTETRSLFTSTETLPVTVVIDTEGAIRDVIEGIMYADEFDQKVKPLLSGARQSNTVRVSTKEKSRARNTTILVNSTGYQPTRIRLQRGVPAQLTFIRKVEETCGREIVIPAYGINRPLPLNTPVTITFTPRRNGRFKFTCGMNMFRGALVVK